MSGRGAFGGAEPSAVGVAGQYKSRLDPRTVAHEPDLLDAAASVFPSEFFGRDSCALEDARVGDKLPCGGRARRVEVRDRLRRRLYRGLARTLRPRANDDAVLSGAKPDHGSRRDGEREHNGQSGLAPFVA